MKSPLNTLVVIFSLIVVALVCIQQVVYKFYFTYTQKSLEITSFWVQNSIIKSKFIPTIYDPVHETINHVYAHPPFSYYFLFFFQKFLFKEHPLLTNVILCILSAIFIYLTIALLTRKKAGSELSYFGLIGVFIYLSSYPVIKFQLLNYHPDIFIQSLIIILNYILLKASMKQKFSKFKYFFWFGIVSFLSCYSSWFGITNILVIIIVGALNYRNSYKMTPFVLVSVFTLMSAIFIVYFQYGAVAGWKDIAYYFKSSFLYQTVHPTEFFPITFKILKNIVRELGVLIFWLIFIIFYSVFSKQKRFRFTKNGYKFILINVVPIFVYGVFLFHYIQFSYLMLFLVPLLVVTIAIWMEKMYEFSQQKSQIIKLFLLIAITNIYLIVFL